jgi:hypothetical protein
MQASKDIDLSTLLRRQPEGERVNRHVVESVNEPQPDFEAMRRLVYGDEHQGKKEERNKR